VDVAIVGGDLGDDHSDHIVRSVSFNDNEIIRLKCTKMGAWVKAVLRVFKHHGVIGAPGEQGVLAGETNERYNNVRKPMMNWR